MPCNCRMTFKMCDVVWERLPRTTCTAASPRQRSSTYGFQAVYQTTDPHWDDPKKETNNRLNTKNHVFKESISANFFFPFWCTITSLSLLFLIYRRFSKINWSTWVNTACILSCNHVGFKEEIYNLVIFNMALLISQIWQINTYCIFPFDL